MASTSTSTPLRVNLIYTRENGCRQRRYVPSAAEEKEEEEEDKRSEIAVEVTMHDARAEKGGVHFSSHGFELVQAPTVLSLEEFKTDSERIKTVYYTEVENAIKKCTGAAHVKCFHHLVRDSSVKLQGAKPRPPPRRKGQGSSTEIEGPAGIVHSDYTCRSSITLCDTMAPKGMRKGRYAIINSWRNIAHTPICDHHLAMCDARSVIAPDDFVICDIVRPDRVNETYRLDPNHSSFHYWLYYPYMIRDEMLLFMQYDSDSSSRSRYTFHSAFKDPTAPSDSPPRQSIEVRCIAFFPDHEPNTIPQIMLRGDEQVNKAVTGIMTSVLYGEQWPETGRVWMGSHLGVPGGVERVLRELVKGGTERAEHGLDRLSDEQRNEVLSKLLEPASMTEFEKRCRAHFNVLPAEQGRANNLTMQLSFVAAWPPSAKAWLRTQLYAGGNAAAGPSNHASLQQIMRTMIRESIKRKEPLWVNTTTADQDAAIAILLSSGEFEREARKHFPPQ